VQGKDILAQDSDCPDILALSPSLKLEINGFLRCQH